MIVYAAAQPMLCIIAAAAAVALTDGCGSSNEPFVEPTPVALADIAVPSGGVAVLFGPQYGCNLVIVATDGSTSFEYGTMVLIPGPDPAHPQWNWQRAYGTLPTNASIGPGAARLFISTANEIPSTYLYPDPYYNQRVHSGMDRPTVYGTIRNGIALFDDYHGQQDPVFSLLGLKPPKQTMPIPTDAVGFIFNSAFFVVYRSGRVTEQLGDFGPTQDYQTYARPETGVYDVEPISRELAWRIVTFAPTVVIPSGCPGLDDTAFYHELFIVTNDHVSNGLFCHRFAPLRDELMSVVREVDPNQH